MELSFRESPNGRFFGRIDVYAGTTTYFSALYVLNFNEGQQYSSLSEV